MGGFGHGCVFRHETSVVVTRRIRWVLDIAVERGQIHTNSARVKRAEVVAIIRKGNAIYCEQMPDGKPGHGLWRFPDFDPARMERGEMIAKIKYGITKYSVVMEAVSAVAVDLRATGSGRYLSIEEMHALAFAAPHRKLIKLL